MLVRGQKRAISEKREGPLKGAEAAGSLGERRSILVAQRGNEQY